MSVISSRTWVLLLSTSTVCPSSWPQSHALFSSHMLFLVVWWTSHTNSGQSGLSWRCFPVVARPALGAALGASTCLPTRPSLFKACCFSFTASQTPAGGGGRVLAASRERPTPSLSWHLCPSLRGMCRARALRGGVERDGRPWGPGGPAALTSCSILLLA